MESSPMNTCLDLEYKCASASYETTVILPGAITREQISQITKGLIDGYQVIAYQIGLPTPLEKMLEEEGIEPSTDDHPLTNLAAWEDDEPIPGMLLSDEEPTHGMDIGTLAAKIEATGLEGWHQLNEMERLELPDDEPETSFTP